MNAFHNNEFNDFSVRLKVIVFKLDHSILNIPSMNNNFLILTICL